MDDGIDTTVVYQNPNHSVTPFSKKGNRYINKKSGKNKKKR